MSYTLQVGNRRFYGLRGNLHIHTVLSDGTKTHQELARIAQQVGLDFVVVTDHNVCEPSHEGWIGKTLVLVGEEVHDPDRQDQSSHLLCFNICQDVAEHAADPQRLIDAVAAQGGFCFLAHPFERDSLDFLHEPNISWRDWGAHGFAGIELWNYMSEFKAVLTSKLHAVLCAYVPALSVSGPFPETLHKWDDLLLERRVSALGGSDAHGMVYHLGPLGRTVQPYDYLFRCVNTHLLSQQPLTGDLAKDRETVYGALAMGCGFLGYEQPGAIAGFAFWGRSGNAEATMGEDLMLDGALEIQVKVPAPGRLRLLRDGQQIAQAHGYHLHWVGSQPGVYRVEVYRRYAGRERGWIFGNPIYVA